MRAAREASRSGANITAGVFASARRGYRKRMKVGLNEYRRHSGRWIANKKPARARPTAPTAAPSERRCSPVGCLVFMKRTTQNRAAAKSAA